MATIISATPNTGISTGRYIVTLDGTDFRLPDKLPLSPTKQESVRVWIGSDQVDPEDVFVQSETQVDFRMLPSMRSIGAQVNNDPVLEDVTVQNIDANGDPIPGTEFTLVDGFSYVKMDMEADSILSKVGRELVRYLRRNLPIPVYFLSHIDYSTGESIPVADGPNDAQEPALYVTGPLRSKTGIGTQVVRNTWPIFDNQFRWLPRATDLKYDLVLVSSRTRVLSNLTPRVDNMIDHMPRINLTIMGKSYEMDIWMVDPMSIRNNVLFSSSLQQSSGTLIIESVPIETDIIRYNTDLSDIIITVGVLNG